MAINFKKQNISVNDRICQDFSQILVENEIIVNEAKPDILKIIQIDTKAFVKNTTLSKNKVVIDGIIDLNIMYVCEREGDTLKSINSSIDFEHTVENSKITSDMQAIVVAEVLRVDFDVVNSRKTRIKINLGLDTAINADSLFELLIEPEDGEPHIQTKKKTVNVYTISSSQNKVFEVQDELILPDSKPNIKEILKVNARLCSKEMRIVTGKAVLQGILDICALYTNDVDGGVEFCQHDVHFSEVFDIANMPESANCEIDITVDKMKWTPKFDSDGNIRKISMSARLSSLANISENSQVNLMTDCYAPYKKCKVAKQMYSFDEFLGESRAQSIVKEVIDLKNGMPSISRIYNVITKPYITSNRVSNGKVYVEGNIDTYILYICDDEFSPVFSYKKEIPFEHTLDVANVREDASCFVKCEVANTSYNIMNDTQVEVRQVLDLSVCLTNMTRCEIVRSVEIEEEPETSKKCAIIIYFVQKGDSLWGIGKKYCVMIEDILKINNMTADDIIKEGQKLIIPHAKNCPK